MAGIIFDLIYLIFIPFFMAFFEEHDFLKKDAFLMALFWIVTFPAYLMYKIGSLI